MIRNETQHRRAIREREDLAASSSGNATTDQRLRELDSEIAEYEALRSGEVDAISEQGVAAMGELLVKARLARGLTMSELGGLLSMTEQQVGRYEQEAWRRASLWRLAQVAEALNLDVDIRASLTVEECSEATGTLAGRGE